VNVVGPPVTSRPTAPLAEQARLNAPVPVSTGSLNVTARFAA
jgi:hypothetical protein